MLEPRGPRLGAWMSVRWISAMVPATSRPIRSIRRRSRILDPAFLISSSDSPSTRCRRRGSAGKCRFGRSWDGIRAACPALSRWRRCAASAAVPQEALSCAEKQRLMALGDDLPTAWTHPDATAETRKAILRAVLKEIVVTLADGRIDLLLHWRGGDYTRLSVPRNRRGQHRGRRPPRWSTWSAGWRGSCRTARSRPRSTDSARRPDEATRGRKRGCAPSATAVALPSRPGPIGRDGEASAPVRHDPAGTTRAADLRLTAPEPALRSAPCSADLRGSDHGKSMG